jgi:rhodanese-related sulfurtransferase
MQEYFQRMGFRLLYYYEPGHYYPQSDIGVSDLTDLLNHLQSSDVKISLVLCCSDIESFLRKIHDMEQVLEIYVCQQHLQLPPGVILPNNYPKAKVIPLNDFTSNWESLAQHNIAVCCQTVNEHADHLNALKDAFNAAQERAKMARERANAADE